MTNTDRSPQTLPRSQKPLRNKNSRRMCSSRPTRSSVRIETEEIQNTTSSCIVPRSNRATGRGDLGTEQVAGCVLGLITASSTPMGDLLREGPTNRRLLGAGRRQSWQESPQGSARTFFYASIKKEIMATSLGSKGSKQPPRYPVVTLAVLEELLSDLSKAVFFRIMAWWLLLQCGEHCGSRIIEGWSPRIFILRVAHGLLNLHVPKHWERTNKKRRDW